MWSHWVDLPKRKPAPEFMKIAGDEYAVNEEQLAMLLGAMFPDSAPLYALRVDGFLLLTFPGEPITAIGLAAKERLREKGVPFPAVAALTNDLIGYILTEDEYHQSGYEVTASFYGPNLGACILDGVNTFIDTLDKPG